jgi:hypothetical protein
VWLYFVAKLGEIEVHREAMFVHSVDTEIAFRCAFVSSHFVAKIEAYLKAIFVHLSI